MSEAFFQGPTVQLAEMLEAREVRAHRQAKLLESYAGAALLSATMNIPGPVKTSPPLAQAFEATMASVERLLVGHICFSKQLPLKTGWEYYLVSDLPALDLKRKLLTIEEGSPLGRLFDLDVLILQEGQVTPISRTDLGLPPRTCYVCTDMAKACSRSRKHSLAEMQAAIAECLKQASGSCP